MFKGEFKQELKEMAPFVLGVFGFTIVFLFLVVGPLITWNNYEKARDCERICATRGTHAAEDCVTDYGCLCVDGTLIPESTSDVTPQPVVVPR